MLSYLLCDHELALLYQVKFLVAYLALLVYSLSEFEALAHEFEEKNLQKLA